MKYNSSSKALYALELKIIINGKEMFMLVLKTNEVMSI